MQAMIQNMNFGITPWHKRSIKPDDTITIIERGKKVSSHRDSFFILKNRKTLAALAGFRKDFLYAFAPFASVCF
jgi:hypothetical protein